MTARATARLLMSRLMGMAVMVGSERRHYPECWRVHDDCALRLASDTISSLLPSAGDVCRWTFDAESMFWRSSCWKEHAFDVGPLEDDWKFCPFCGCAISQETSP